MVDDLKTAARKAAVAVRKQAFAAGQGQAAEILADYLATRRGCVLAGYMPMRTEIDPLPAMAVHQGAVGVPVIAPVEGLSESPACSVPDVIVHVNPPGNPPVATNVWL